MTENNEYDFKPSDKPAPPPRPKPGDPDFVPPIPIIEPPDPPSRFERTPEPEPEPVDPDITHHKALAILAYVFFVIPLVAAPQSKFARFHANQGLLSLIVWGVAIFAVILIQVLSLFTAKLAEAVPILGAFFTCIFYLAQPLLLVGALILTIMGIIHAANGEKKGLPLIGHWTLIK